MLELDRTDIKAPIPLKACDSFSLSCTHCEQGAPHPSPQESDWSSEDWDSTKAKVREQTDTLIDFNEPRPQTDNDKTTDIDEVAFSKLQIGQRSKGGTNRDNRFIDFTTTSDRNTRRCNRKHQQRRTIRSREEASEGRRKYDLYRRVYVGQLSE